MKQITIFRYIRDPKNFDKIRGKYIQRVVNVHPSFIGIGTDGNINRTDFKRLADDLEPTNEGFTVL